MHSALHSDLFDPPPKARFLSVEILSFQDITSAMVFTSLFYLESRLRF